MKTAAIDEHIVQNCRYTVRNFDCLKAITIRKGLGADACQTRVLGDLSLNQICAVSERGITNACNRSRNIDTKQIYASLKSLGIDTGHILGNDYACKRRASGERIILNACQAFGKNDFGQATAICECLCANTCHTGWDCDIGKRVTIEEHPHRKLRDSFGNHELSQTGARKSLTADARHWGIRGDRHGAQILTPYERTIADTCYSFRNCNVS